MFKEREGNARNIIGIVLLAMIGYVAVIVTDFDYMYTRKVFIRFSFYIKNTSN